MNSKIDIAFIPLQTCALFLVAQGATINRPRRYDNGEAPIHTACRHAMNDVIRALVRKGGDVNLTLNTKGSTPLHIAIKERHSWTVKVLCECGADVNARDSTGVRD